MFHAVSKISQHSIVNATARLLVEFGSDVFQREKNKKDTRDISPWLHPLVKSRT